MDYPPRHREERLKSETSTAPTRQYLRRPTNYNNIYHRQYSMYATNNQANNKGRVSAADFHRQDNIKNCNCIGINYPSKQSLNADNMIEQPKKEGLWQSVYRSATNLFGEHFNRGTGSLIKNWTNINSPLSVTVVSPDILKTLHAPGVQESINVDPNNLFTTTTSATWCSGSTNNKDSSDETLASVLYDNDIMSCSCKIKLAHGSFVSASDPGDVDRRWQEYKCMYVDCNEREQERMKRGVVDDNNSGVNKSEMRDVDLESIESIVIKDEKDVDRSANFGSTLSLDDKPVILEPMEPEFPVKTHEQTHQQQSPEQPTTVCSTPPSSSVVGVLLSNAYNKVVNGVTDLLQIRLTSPEPEPTALFSKRASDGCPKPKKVHAISSGRGRGRAKSQLRRSGVSQKRHRKERSRYDRSDDIKYDIDNWEEMNDDCVNDDEVVESMDVCDFGGSISCYKGLLTISLEDIKPTKKKQKRRGLCHSNLSKTSSTLNLNNKECSREDDESHNDNYHEDDDDEEDEEDEDDYDEDEDEDDYEDDDVESDDSETGYVQFRCPTRARLSSVSSVDSDDSFCIVFNDNNESKTDIDAEAETDVEDEVEVECKVKDESEEESDFNMDEWKPSKIRFDLTPTVHTIVHWRYAYKAARRGPWEEMARDRARFRRRIMEVDAAIKPVFAVSHRARIWNERFAAAP